MATDVARRYFWKDWLIEAIRDWGTGLDLALYTDAIVHVLGGLERIEHEIDVISDETVVGKQPVLLTSPKSMLKVTAFHREPNLMEGHLQRFLRHTRLDAFQGVNVTGRCLTFRTLRR